MAAIKLHSVAVAMDKSQDQKRNPCVSVGLSFMIVAVCVAQSENPPIIHCRTQPARHFSERVHPLLMLMRENRTT